MVFLKSFSVFIDVICVQNVFFFQVHLVCLHWCDFVCRMFFFFFQVHLVCLHWCDFVCRIFFFFFSSPLSVSSLMWFCVQNVFDHLGQKEVLRARSRSNPYETIGKVFFQNRAALKMANLDAVTGFMFTNPVLEGSNVSHFTICG